MLQWIHSMLIFLGKRCNAIYFQINLQSGDSSEEREQFDYQSWLHVPYYERDVFRESI